MSIKIEYNVAKEALYVTLTGQVTMQQLAKTIDEIDKSEKFDPSARTLVDIRELDFNQINSDFLQEIISLEKKNENRVNTRVAYIAGTDVNFGMSRMYQILADDLPKRAMIFRDYDEGEKWLLS